MGKPNYGKDFENIVKADMLKVEGVDVQRLYDSTNGFTGIRNPSDFIIYKYPYQYYIECKATWENTLRPDKVTQLSDLVQKSLTFGVIAGVIVWFISHDITIFVSAEYLAEHYRTHKSLNIKEVKNNEIPHLVIEGQKRRVFFEYNFEDFFRGFDYA